MKAEEIKLNATQYIAIIAPILIAAFAFFQFTDSRILQAESRFEIHMNRLDNQMLELRKEWNEYRKESDRKWEETQKEIKEIKIGVARLEERE
jgi:hypothetical protein